MNLFRTTTLLALAALLPACASSPPAAAPAPAAASVVEAANDAPPPAAADPVVDDAPVVADAAAEVPPPAAGSPASSPRTQAEDDFAALYGEDAYNPVADPTLPDAVQSPRAYDPWEKYNRRVHRFNNAVDRTIARPLARAYVEVVPRPVRLGVTNFFDNLRSPVTLVNQVLQGRPRDAAQTLGRFVLNSTLGIAGLFDPASDLKMKRRSEDFGQTLGVWGWRDSRYLELPFFGPRTVRDGFGLLGDAPLSVTRQVDDNATRYTLQGLQLVDTRAQLLSLDSLRADAVDDYALVRDSWMQRRNYQIESGRRKAEEDELPEYLRDEESNPTVPVDAMPIPDIGTPPAS
ncbi:VacJ family lipoprotein [Pseudoxanthomonas mexicana]|uniref:MlaA family lipoprotein n=1 Tax=Pseudoxanthomonas mexicana TaxID=128785 RepID=UPI00398BAA63